MIKDKFVMDTEDGLCRYLFKINADRSTTIATIEDLHSYFKLEIIKIDIKHRTELLEIQTRKNKIIMFNVKLAKARCADELDKFIDGERIIGADTHNEQLMGQGKNQAYDIVCEYLKKWRKI